MHLSHMDKKTIDSIDSLVIDIKETCMDNLVSIYLYGSAAGKGYIPGRSNLNTLILLKDVGIDTLKGISRIYKKKGKERFVVPLVLSPAYITSSTDVFPIEFLDIKEKAVLMAGDDILKGIDIELSHLREECEREIKGQLVRIRGSFLEVEGDSKGMERLITSAVSNIIFPLKNILRLMKEEIPEGDDDVIRRCCKAMNASDTGLLEALALKRGEKKSHLEGLYDVLSGYMMSVEEISRKIDALKSEGRL